MNIFIKGILVALITAAFDQWSKDFIFDLLLSKETHMIEVTSFFNLVMVKNYGISFGMFDELPYGQFILSFIAIAIVLVLCHWLYKTPKLYVGIALGLIIGGAIGNIIDRVLFGAVSDFLDFYIGLYHWPAFNVADSAVFIGVVILCFDSYIEHKSGMKNEN